MNNVQLMGNLARDPKVSVTRTGKTLVRMTVACSKTYKGRDGQAKEMTSFVPVTCWPPSSDLAQSLLKGDRVVVMGRFTTDTRKRSDRQ
ncbi:single-stranded DNA-binding protein [Megasphaera sp. CLA-AA-H81]|uniref:Single-stranded DNA-binding protein n=1 Tax=Megasphaera intestinihominis TaxID=3133159 RepID=A0ABV1CZX4_9FIRM